MWYYWPENYMWSYQLARILGHTSVYGGSQYAECAEFVCVVGSRGERQSLRPCGASSLCTREPGVRPVNFVLRTRFDNVQDNRLLLLPRAEGAGPPDVRRNT